MQDDALGREHARLLRRVIDSATLELVEVWVRYFSLGGNAEQLELDAFLHHALVLSSVERDVLAHAVNELIDDRPVLYAPYNCDLSYIDDDAPRDSKSPDCEKDDNA